MAVYIDTDIGSDVDDTLAIMYARARLDVAGITTVHACAAKRAQIAAKIVDVPVYSGIDKPLISDKLYLMGCEGNGFLTGDEKLQPSDAVGFLNDKLKAGDTLVGIGPLTNIATLITKYPDVKNRLRGIYLQGSLLPDNTPDLEKHNFKVDSEATRIVFDAGIPLTLLPTAIGKRVSLNAQDFKRLPEGYIYDYIRNHAEEYMDLRGQDRAYLYDPLTVMLLTRPEFFHAEVRGNKVVITDVDEDSAKQDILNAFGVK